MEKHIEGVHNNIRNHFCGECGYASPWKGALKLKQHVKAVHKIGHQLKCDHCKHPFISTSSEWHCKWFSKLVQNHMRDNTLVRSPLSFKTAVYVYASESALCETCAKATWLSPVSNPASATPVTLHEPRIFWCLPDVYLEMLHLILSEGRWDGVERSKGSCKLHTCKRLETPTRRKRRRQAAVSVRSTTICRSTRLICSAQTAPNILSLSWVLERTHKTVWTGAVFVPTVHICS